MSTSGAAPRRGRRDGCWAFGGNLGSATESDALQVVASYELYGSVLLQVGGDGSIWPPVVDGTVARLEAEVQRLRLQLAPPPPTLAELREALTPASVARFRGGLPVWMGAIFDALRPRLPTCNRTASMT